MKLIGIYDALPSDFNQPGSVFIAASGYEQRSSASISLLDTCVGKRVALGFSEYKNVLHRPENDTRFASAQFDPIEASGGDAHVVEDTISEILRDDDVTVLIIDISSMTRAWHGAVIRALRSSRRSAAIQTFFVYVPGVYTPPPQHITPLEKVGPLEGFASFAPPNLPVALALGLGYERERAIGLQELLDPRMTALMIPRTGADDSFFTSVSESNSEILSRTNQQWTFEYPLNSALATFRTLESVCLGLEREYRVVLASLGPKLFGVLCLLLATVNPQLSVWRVTSGAMGEPRDVIGDLAKLVVCRTVWEP